MLELQQTQENNEEMNGVYTQFRSQKNAISDVLTKKEAELEIFRNQLSDLNQENSILKQNNESFQYNLKNRDATTTELKSNLNLHQRNLADLMSRVMKAEKKVNELEIENKEKTDIANQLSKDNHLLKSELEKKDNVMARINLDLKDSKNSKESSELTKHALIHSNSDLKGRLQKSELDLEKYLIEIRKKESECLEQKKVDIELREDLEKSQKNVVQLQKQVELQEKQIKHLDKELTINNNVKNSLNQNLEYIKLEKVQCDKKIKEKVVVEGELSELKSDHLSLEMECRNIKREKIQLQHTYDHLCKRIETKEETIEKLRKENESLVGSNMTFNEKLNSINSRIDTLIIDRNHFRKLYQQSQTELDQTRKDNDNMKYHVIDMENSKLCSSSQVESLQKEVEQYQAIEQQRMTTITDIREKQKQQNSEKQSLLRNLSLITEEKNKIFQQKTNLEKQLHNLEKVKCKLNIEFEKLNGLYNEQLMLVQDKESENLRVESLCKCQTQEIQSLKRTVEKMNQEHEMHSKVSKDWRTAKEELERLVKLHSDKASQYKSSLVTEFDHREKHQNDIHDYKDRLDVVQSAAILNKQKREELINLVEAKDIIIGNLNIEIMKKITPKKNCVERSKIKM
eukprot:UN34483